MSFAILRHAKIKSTTKGAAISHNHRLGDDDKINIDKARSHLNIYLNGHGAKDRIDTKMPQKHRKDAVVAVEILLSSGPEFFDGIETDREKLAVDTKFLAWVDRSIGWAKKEFGANLVDAVLHMDESTPHIHLLTVPLTKDGRLCAKEVTARAEMQRRQTEYAEAMKAFGLERGTPANETKREHIPLKGKPGSGGKAAQEAKVQAALLSKMQGELAKAQDKITRKQALNVANMHLINKIEGEAKIMVKAIATANERDHELVAEITALRAENKDAQASLEQLRAIDRVIIDQTRERLERERLEKENATLKQELSKAPYLHAMITGRIGNTMYMLTPASEIFASEEDYLEFVSQAAKEHQEEIEGAQRAQEAFSEKWAGIQPASAEDTPVGVVVDVCGNRVVYHIGRGVHAIHTFAPGEIVPKMRNDTEQKRNGIER